MHPALRAFSATAASALLLSGCFLNSDSPATASSSSSSSGSGSGSTQQTTTTLSGVAMAGALNGTVCAYTLSDAGVAGTTSLACTTTTSTGSYTLSWPAYVGNVILKAYGSYVDEATGLTKTITEANPLRSTAACTGSTCNAAITPLTEAAVRAAASQSATDLAAAYLKVAQAFGVSASTASDAIAKLVTRIPAASGTDADALAYARLLAVVSQAQSGYCGTTCDQETYLAAIKTLLAGASGVTDIQTALNVALTAWNANPHNTAGVNCSASGNVITCNLPTSGSGSGTSTAGNYKLTISVVVQGVNSANVVVNNVPKPSTQSEFCDSTEVKEQLNQSMSGAGGSWTLNSCSFSGNNGTISATVSQTTPVGTMTIPYTVNYTYSAM